MFFPLKFLASILIEIFKNSDVIWFCDRNFWRIFMTFSPLKFINFSCWKKEMTIQCFKHSASDCNSDQKINSTQKIYLCSFNPNSCLEFKIPFDLVCTFSPLTRCLFIGNLAFRRYFTTFTVIFAGLHRWNQQDCHISRLHVRRPIPPSSRWCS